MWPQSSFKCFTINNPRNIFRTPSIGEFHRLSWECAGVKRTYKHRNVNEQSLCTGSLCPEAGLVPLEGRKGEAALRSRTLKEERKPSTHQRELALKRPRRISHFSFQFTETGWRMAWQTATGRSHVSPPKHWWLHVNEMEFISVSLHPINIPDERCHRAAARRA